MSLTSDLLKPVREKSGSIASSRFDYQKEWSLSKLLELHQKGEDYVLIFEHDEDLIVLDSESNPEKITCYQVKTKDGTHWNLSELLTRKKTKKSIALSFVGKLYYNKLRYGNHVESINFISNVPYAFGPGVTKKEICVSDCKKEDIDKIAKQLKKEHSLKTEPSCSIIFFKVADLSLVNPTKHLLGELATFFATLYPHKKFQIDLIHKVFFDEVRKKINSEGEPKDFNGLLQRKSLSRAGFTKMLDAVTRETDDIWITAKDRLNLEGEDIRAIHEIKSALSRYELCAMDASNTLHIKLCKEISKIVSALVKTPASYKIVKEFLNEVVRQYKVTRFGYSNNGLYGDSYIKAIALVKFYEHKL